MRKIGIEISDELFKKMKTRIILEDETVKSYLTNLIKKDLETKKDIR